MLSAVAAPDQAVCRRAVAFRVRLHTVLQRSAQVVVTAGAAL